MDAKRKAARDWLKAAKKADFEKAVQEANLTPFDEDVLRLFIVKGCSRNFIADTKHCSEATIRRALSRAYNKI